MTSTPDNVSTSPEATAVARDLIASFGQDPARYVPGTVSTLPGTRTTTYVMACSPRCPHDDQRCHRPHAAWLNDERLRAQMDAAPRSPGREHARLRVPAQRRRA